MKVKLDGTYAHYVKSLNDEQLNKILELVDKNINEARDNIISGNFDINPKVLGDVDKGCEFCQFKDICYKKSENIVYLKNMNAKDFLGGDDFA